MYNLTILIKNANATKECGNDVRVLSIRVDLENCAYLWKNPGYAPDYITVSKN